MLMEEGVIQKGEERWEIHLDRLAGIQTPSTLTEVLQSRLDALPPEEKMLLQRASVIGRVFWDEAVSFLTAQGLTRPSLLRAGDESLCPPERPRDDLRAR